MPCGAMYGFAMDNLYEETTIKGNFVSRLYQNASVLASLASYSLVPAAEFLGLYEKCLLYAPVQKRAYACFALKGATLLLKINGS